MTIYFIWFVIALVAYMASLSKRLNPKSKIFLAFFLFMLALFIGFSDMLGGYDRYIYAQLFDEIADTAATGSPFTASAISYYGTEIGYGYLNVILSYITANRYIFILIVTLIIYALLYKSLSDYTDNYPLAVIVFLGLWVFFTFTYLRQVLGTTIAWLGIKYIINRDFKRFLLVSIIAYSFHNSALIFFPLYFIPIQKFSKSKVLIVMTACLLLGLSGIPMTLFEIYGETDSERINQAGYAVDMGARYAYMMESALFLYIILKNYHKIPTTPKHIVLLNIALCFCGTLLLFLRSDNGGRLAWYYLIGIIATLVTISTPKKNIGQTIFLIVLSGLLYFRILSSWGILLYPYKTFFTNGIRKGDFIEERYEYDHGYDYDKMYRAPLRIN